MKTLLITIFTFISIIGYGQCPDINKDEYKSLSVNKQAKLIRKNPDCIDIQRWYYEDYMFRDNDNSFVYYDGDIRIKIIGGYKYKLFSNGVVHIYDPNGYVTI